MGFDGNGSARGAIRYAFDCIGPRIGIGTVDARLAEIGHAANDPAAMSLDARRQARLRSWPPVDNRGRKARVWRPEPNPQAATCARPRWFEAECGKARAERLKVRLDQGPGRDAGGRDQTRRPWAGGYDYQRGRSPNTARPTAPVPIARPFPVPVYSTLSDTSVIRIMCGFTPSSSSAGTASFG